MVDCAVYQDGLGYLIDPESDTKQIFIPSPPSMNTVKIHPRPAIILISGGEVGPGCSRIDDLKSYADENKVVLVCPASNEPEKVAESFAWLDKKHRLLNVRQSGYSVMATPGNLEDAREVTEYICERFDVDLPEAAELVI